MNGKMQSKTCGADFLEQSDPRAIRVPTPAPDHARHGSSAEIRISLEPRAAPRLANRLPNCDDAGRPCRLRSLRGYCRNWGNRPGSQRRRPDASARPSSTGTSPALRSSELGPEADREIADDRKSVV